MADGDFDLDAYLRRIGYGGPREASLPVLRGVVGAHAHTIPFENIDVLLGRGIRIDLAAIGRKLVAGGRGGYCFEHAGLLEAALLALGFSVTPLLASVVRGFPDPVLAAPRSTPRGHKVLRVELSEGLYLADVGFGNLTPTVPLALRPGAAQPTPHEPYRLLAQGGEFVVQAGLGGAWENLYRFTLDPVPEIDCVVANWFTSTFPGSPFTSNLIVARPLVEGRATLFNRRFAIRDRDGRVSRRILAGAEDYREVLVERFGLSLAADEPLAIAQAMAAHAPDEAVHRFFLA
jgi:N-hydroxyarylamine O-acetyltransferase